MSGSATAGTHSYSATTFRRPRPGRRVVAFVATALAALAGAVVLGAYLYEHGRSDLIAPGVRAAGIPIGGLSVAQARARLEQRLSADSFPTILVQSPAGTFHLTGRAAHVTADVETLVDRALARSQSGSFLSRAVRDLTGGRVDASIPLRVTYSHHAVRVLVARIRAALDRPAEDATVTPSATSLTTVPGRDGLRVASTKLTARIDRALIDRAAPHDLLAATVVVHPRVTIAQLTSTNPAYILVDRGGFKLRLFQNLKLTRTYSIAVGMQGLATPAGLYHIQWKQVDPPWYVPNSSWAGKLAGKTIPPGPQDPLKARFMSFDGGAGIHGIAPSEYSSIGHDASHGCVRMRIPDVIDLYARTPVGTPVFIA